MKTTTKYFSWGWKELPGPEHAAFAETWTHNDEGALIGRERVPLAKKPKQATISTDPRAAAIMREELGIRRGKEMGGPHWQH